jgi:hypothetical protein
MGGGNGQKSAAAREKNQAKVSTRARPVRSSSRCRWTASPITPCMATTTTTAHLLTHKHTYSTTTPFSFTGGQVGQGRCLGGTQEGPGRRLADLQGLLPDLQREQHAHAGAGDALREQAPEEGRRHVLPGRRAEVISSHQVSVIR